MIWIKCLPQALYTMKSMENIKSTNVSSLIIGRQLIIILFKSGGSPAVKNLCFGHVEVSF
jgi:hypothetical protein